MTDVVSFRPTEDMEEEIERERALADGDLSRSLAAKGLVGETVEARNTAFWFRRDIPRRYAAQMEDARLDGEDDDDVVEKLLIEAVKARREDVLDALDAAPELREAVEAEQSEGETLRETTLRLLRDGLDADTDPPSVWERAGVGLALAGFGLAFGYLWLAYGPIAVALAAVATVSYLTAYPYLNDAAGRLLSALPSSGGR